jgi:Mn2+/Fe2+ NRAMP family transporter
MTNGRDPIAVERALLREARAKGRLATLAAYIRCSGPGWLQGAITLGGGSLAGSLYLGVISGYSLLWIQVFAMGAGVVMLSAITYVTLSTGKRPFQAIREHVNPVLAWGWAIATLIANIVWCLPQFSVATAAALQNLAPGLPEAMGGAAS